MTAAAAAKLMIDLSAGRNGRPSGGKSVKEMGSLGCDSKLRGALLDDGLKMT